MKKGYIPKEERKKILLLCDDIRLHSGIGTMAKEFVINTAHHFNWVNLGAAIKHPEAGKAFDLSNQINEIAGLSDSDVKVIPFDGYGNDQIIRQLINQEKPDAILHFTDPRYWTWLYRMEKEIRTKSYFLPSKNFSLNASNSIPFGTIYLTQCGTEISTVQTIFSFVSRNKPKIWLKTYLEITQKKIGRCNMFPTVYMRRNSSL